MSTRATVLALAQAFCYRMNLPAPSTLLSLTSPGDLQIRQIIYDVCEELRAEKCWTQQKRVYTFDTTSGRTKYNLPQDFYALNYETSWNSDQTLPLVGPASDQYWNYILQNGTSTADFAFRLWGGDSNPNTGQGQFEINPTPTDAQTLSFEYFTRNLFLPPDWAASTAYVIGNYVNVSNNIYLCDTNGTSGTTAPTAQTQNITDGSTRWDFSPGPYETIQLNTDIPLFDSDIVKLGLRAHWKGDKGEENDRAMEEYLGRISQAKRRFQGSQRGSFEGPLEPKRRYNVPWRSWSI